jgi:hypothetical protein
MKMEFEFTLPRGYFDADGNLHRRGVMRLSRAIDEIAPLRDPRVKANPAYATVLILARVIIQLGALDDVDPMVIENLFAGDLSYLQNLYRAINQDEIPQDLDPAVMTENNPIPSDRISITMPTATTRMVGMSSL